MKLKAWFKLSWIAIVIGFLVFPAVTLGGTFTASLIQGKTPEEAVSILADQFDLLIGRVEKLEDFQKQQDTINNLQSQLNAVQGNTNTETGQQIATTAQNIASLNEIIKSQKEIISQQQTTISTLSTNQATQEHKIECDRLKTVTLSWGVVSLVNVDVVRWYENIIADEAQWRTNKTDDDFAAAKKLYDTYVTKCGK